MCVKMKKVTPNVGFDICYGCGKPFEYGTLKDVNEIDFVIYCSDCKPELYEIIFKVLDEVEWEEIEVGEVFYANGIIDYKISKNKSTYLANACPVSDYDIYTWSDFDKRIAKLYKLPKNVQNLFITK